MLVNPSIYNNTGKYTSNYDLLTLEKRSGVPSSRATNTGYPYTNSLTEQINRKMYQSVLAFDTSFKPDLKSILNTTKLLASNKSTVYDDRKAVDTSKAFDVKANEGAALGKQTLNVSQIATAQKNTSFARLETETFKNDLNGQFNISKNGKTKSIDFTFKQGETVEDGYLRLSKTINQSTAGVTAKVNTDENGFATMAITSNETGKDAGFELSGTLADAMKLNDNQNNGQNMKYVLNGNEGESTNNRLELQNGKIQIDVTAVNEKAETFEVQESQETLVSTLNEFAQAFNQFVADQKNSDNPMTKSIVNQMTNTVKKTLDKLDLKGIQMDNSGQVVVDDAQLNKDLEGNVDRVKEELTDFDSFAANLTRKTEQILKAPSGNYAPSSNAAEQRSSASALKAYMYNYSAQSMINNLNQLNTTGGIMDIRI